MKLSSSHLSQDDISDILEHNDKIEARYERWVENLTEVQKQRLDSSFKSMNIFITEMNLFGERHIIADQLYQIWLKDHANGTSTVNYTVCKAKKERTVRGTKRASAPENSFDVKRDVSGGFVFQEGK